MVTITKVAYGGWPNCYRIANEAWELILTSDIGPRVIRCALLGGQNMFKEFSEQMGRSGESTWQIRGGHRLWIGPEALHYTYGLDNAPVRIEINDDIITATQPIESETGMEKQLTIEMHPSQAKAKLTHRFTNRNRLAVEIAPWAPTVMAPGGVGITGFPPRGTHPEMLAPTNPLVMWAYTDWSDPRWIFMKKYLALRQDPSATTPQKTGLFNENTWGAYLLGRDLFLKQYKADLTKTYPEYGCSFQTFTNQDFLELETFGPLTRLGFNQSTELIEVWSLGAAIVFGDWTDANVSSMMEALLVN
jgi:hypothetical protein